METSVYKKVGIASLIMMGSIFLSRIIGILREVVIAYAAGAGQAVDAYQTAFVLPELLNHLAATGFLSITLIPIFDRYFAKGRENEAWRVFSLIFIIFGSLVAALIVPACIWAHTLVGWAAPGIKDPDTLALAVRMTRIVLPAQFFFFAGSMLMAVQFAKKRFFIPALAPLIYNLGIILGGLLLGPHLGIEGFAWGVVAGAVVGNFALQCFGACREGLKITVHVDIFHPDLRRYVILTLPLMLGLTMTFSTEFFFRFFGSYMPEGTISALNYGLRVMFVLVGLFGQAVGTAIYPFMSRLVAQGRLDEMNELLNTALRYLSLVIPFSVLFMVLRHEVVFILYQGGRFDAAATEITSHLLPYLLVGAFAFSVQTVVARGYYAMQDTLSPAIFCTVALLLSIPLYLLGMDWLGPAGVALGISFSALLQVLTLYVFWNRRTNNPGSRKVYGHVAKMILLGCLLGVILEGFKKTTLTWIDPWTKPGAFYICVILAALFLVLIVPAARIMGITELQDMLAGPLKKIKDRLSH